MRGYEAAKILKEKGITIEDVNDEIAYRKETNALSNNPKNEAFMNMTLNEVLRIKEMWDV
jgi:acetyl-CoA acetyltransferase